MILFCAFPIINTSQEDYLKIEAGIEPRLIKQGEEGTLKLKITPQHGIKISSHPDFIIRLNKNSDFSFSKSFFTAPELDFPTTQNNEAVYLELGKEINILFRVNDDSMIGKHAIGGEVVFTAVFKNNWSLKTYQRFNVDFFTLRQQKIKLKKK
ncbi:MAG: hypothetical protein ACM3SY_15340 [Candidatus Omnitrophota bacterium]